MSNFVKQFQNINSRPMVGKAAVQENRAKEKTNKAKLLVESTEFDGTVKSKTTTTVKFSHLVNQLFKVAFDDYTGCQIVPDQTGRLQVSLFFRAGATTKTSMVQPIDTVNKHSTTTQKLQAIHNRSISAQKFEMTEYGKEIMEDFIFPNAGNGKYNWNQLSFEVAESTMTGYAVYLKIVGLNLNKIISTIYGKGSDETRFEYDVQIIRPLPMGQNYLISIQQLNCADVEELCREFGMQQQIGTIQMIRA